MTWTGLYRGVCADSSDPQQRHRLRVRVPQLMGDVVLSGWAEPCLPPVGALALRDVAPGERVWVMFEGGDVDFPVWMGVAG